MIQFVNLQQQKKMQYHNNEVRCFTETFNLNILILQINNYNVCICM